MLSKTEYQALMDHLKSIDLQLVGIASLLQTARCPHHWEWTGIQNAYHCLKCQEIWSIPITVSREIDQEINDATK